MRGRRREPTRSFHHHLLFLLLLLLSLPSLCSLSFWSVYPWVCVCERRGGWQVAVCKGIEAYEIFTKAIMTPWTEWSGGRGRGEERRGEERRGEERRGGGGGERRETGEWRVPVFFFFVRSEDEQRWKRQTWDFQTLVVLWIKDKRLIVSLGGA